MSNRYFSKEQFLRIFVELMTFKGHKEEVYRFYGIDSEEEKKKLVINIVKALIETTIPVRCSDNGLEIHTIIGDNHIGSFLWSIKSLFYFSPRRYKVVLHSDGSLGNEDKEYIGRHIKGIEIVDKEQADKRAASALEKFPYCFGCRLRKTISKFRDTMMMKLFDFSLFSSKKYCLSVDSDVLFFDDPYELATWIPEETLEADIVYNLDREGYWYTISKEEAKKYYAVELIDRLNAGLTAYMKDFLDLAFIDKIIQSMGDIYGHIPVWVEQTIVALLASRQGSKARMLPPEKYKNYPYEITPNTVSIHFSGTRKKSYFYKIGVFSLFLEGKVLPFIKSECQSIVDLFMSNFLSGFDTLNLRDVNAIDDRIETSLQIYSE